LSSLGTIKGARWRGVSRCLTALVCVGFGLSGRTQSVALPLLPTSVAYDAAGDLFFADTNRQEVYESSLAGVLIVVAGNGVQGYSGDGGAAMSANLNSPEGVAVGPDGTLYIADTGNERIRAVSGGVISTFAGTGSAGFGGDGGAATAAMFRRPNALAVNATGALLVSDANNQRVREISAGVISTIVGSGVQGFGGDGGPAVSAMLNAPMGLAVGGDGRVFVADSHNDRIRVIATDGTISTFAGSGARGFSGDGGPATAAALSMPRGLLVTASGAVIFADSNNQRIRMVTAGGTISTVVGNGVQGSASDGSAETASTMNSPRGVAVSSFGAPVYADTLNHLVRESLANGNVYAPAGLAAGRASSVALTANASGTYGQTSVSVTVTGGAGTPQGVVELMDGSTVAGQTTLSAGAGTVGPVALSVGTHTLSAAYTGDGVNPAATSATVTTTVAATVITATANAASVEYGQAIPTLAGTLSGVLPKDAGTVMAVFSTTASTMSPVGSYPITATLSGAGSGNYVLAPGTGSGSLRILPAASATTEQPFAQGAYAGLPMSMTAKVNATTPGIPTGTVQFLDAGTVVATAKLTGGMALGTYLAPAAGVHSLIASYGGDGNFSASSSPAMTMSVSAMPDFTMTTTGSTTQTVASGDVANFGVAVGAAGGPFTGVVGLSVSGLPAGMTVAFAPPQVVPGAGSASVTMSVQTTASLPGTTMLRWRGGALWAGLALPCLFVRQRRRGRRYALLLGSVMLLIVGAGGCGARTISTTAGGTDVSADGDGNINGSCWSGGDALGDGDSRRAVMRVGL
jgi:hypothetical protein